MGWVCSRSSEVAPFGSLGITSYSSSVVTVAVGTQRLWDIRLQTVGWPWNWVRVTQSSKVPPFDNLGMVSYSTSVATMAVSRTVSEIHQLIGQKLPNFLTPLYSAPLLEVKPSELSNDPRWWKTRTIGLWGSKRILTKCLAVLIQSTCVTHRQAHRETDRRKCHSIYPR